MVLRIAIVGSLALLAGCASLPPVNCVYYPVTVCEGQREPMQDMLFLSDEEWIEIWGEPRPLNDQGEE